MKVARTGVKAAVERTLMAVASSPSSALPPADTFEGEFPRLQATTVDGRLRELGVRWPVASNIERGSSFAARIRDLREDHREDAIERALVSGHLPSSLRELCPVQIPVTWTKRDGVTSPFPQTYAAAVARVQEVEEVWALYESGTRAASDAPSDSELRLYYVALQWAHGVRDCPPEQKAALGKRMDQVMRLRHPENYR